MPKDPIGESWAGSTYNGFAGHSAGGAAPPPPPHAHGQDHVAPSGGGRNRKLLIGGVAGAVALGLVFGIWARPQFGEDGRERGPMQPVTAQPVETASVPASVPVEVARPAPEPIPRADGPLEVLPPEMAAATPDVVRSPARTAPTRAEPAPTRRVPEFAQAPPRVVVPRSAPEAAAPVTARVAEPPPFVAPRREAVRPSFNCRYARSTSEEMVCADPELAAADRRLNRAYNRAVASGIPARELRAEQDDWLQIREHAARRSPQAVASVYEQRIRELNSLADDGQY
jgi:uncharacterized protein YecT (DUF1311 family)